MNRMTCWAGCLALAALAGCGGGKDLGALSTAELGEAARASRSEASEARASGHPDEAEAAARQAEAALELLRTRDDASESLLAQAEGDAAGARLEADFAEEEAHLRKIAGGIKARVYRTARDAALAAVLEGLALAAERAAGAAFDELDQPTQEAATLAENIAVLLGAPKGDPPDWKQIAAALRAQRQTPAVRLNFLITAALLVTAQDDLALAELSSLDPAALSSPEDKLAYHVLRGIAASLQGCRLTAAHEYTRAAGDPVAGAQGPQIQGALHLLAATAFMLEKNYERADLELVRSMKAWPDNPAAVFLTGEQLSAEGEWEKAAFSLEQAAAGSEEEWIAEHLIRRARELRDSKGEAEPLLYDASLQRKIILWQIAKLARDSKPARKVQEWVDAARGFGRRMTEKLPGNETEGAPAE